MARDVIIKASTPFLISFLIATVTIVVSVSLYAGALRSDVDYSIEGFYSLSQIVEENQKGSDVSRQDLLDKIDDEKESRKQEYTEIQVELAEIGTHLIYIRNYLEKIEGKE